MTRHKNFKRLVRERMAHTNENYTTARRRLLEEKTYIKARAWDLQLGHKALGDGGVDPRTTHEGRRCLCLDIAQDSEGGGSLVQTIDAYHYRGARIRFSGWVRCSSPMATPCLSQGSVNSNLGGGRRSVHALAGPEWARLETVLDVPDTSNTVWFGITIGEPGTIWLSSPSFEVVDASVPVTDAFLQSEPHIHLADAPHNLDFCAPGVQVAPSVVDWLYAR